MNRTSYTGYTARQALSEQDRAGLERLIADAALEVARKQLVDSDPLLQYAQQLGAVITPVASRVSPIGDNTALIDQPTQSPVSTIVDTKPVIVPAAESMSVMELTERHTLIDIDLLRISDNRDELRNLRVWAYGHQFNRMGDDTGKVEKAALFTYLSRLGIINSKRTFDDILATGDGLYWTQAYHRNADGISTRYIHLTGWARLAKQITLLELAKEPFTVPIEAPCQIPITMRSVDTNRPGSTRVWLDLSGSIADMRATGYSAWLAVKAAKYGYIEISRRVLQSLWRKSRTTLIEMEKRARVKVQPVYCEHNDPDAPLVPSYAYPAIDANGKIIATWRESNRYLPNPVNIHQHGGQRRRVRKLVNAEIDASKPVLDNGDGLPSGRRNFDHGKHSAKCVSIREDGSKHYAEVFTPPTKLLKKHIERDGKKGVKPHRHNLYLGSRFGVHIREMSTGDQSRSIAMQRDLHAEATPDFRGLRSQYRRGWVDRWV